MPIRTGEDCPKFWLHPIIELILDSENLAHAVYLVINVCTVNGQVEGEHFFYRDDRSKALIRSLLGFCNDSQNRNIQVDVKHVRIESA